MLSVIIRLINPSFRVTIIVIHSKAANLFIRKSLEVKLVSSLKLAGSFVSLEVSTPNSEFNLIGFNLVLQFVFWYGMVIINMKF